MNINRRNFLGSILAGLPLTGVISKSFGNDKPKKESRIFWATKKCEPTPSYLTHQDVTPFITDPDDFKEGDVVIDAKNYIVHINVPCTLQAVYTIVSRAYWQPHRTITVCREDLMYHPRIFDSITRETFDLLSPWEIMPESIKNIRSSGLYVELFEQIYMGIIILGQTLDTTHIKCMGKPFTERGPVNCLVAVPDRLIDKPEKVTFEAGDCKTCLSDIEATTVEPICYRIPIFEGTGTNAS